MQFSHSEQKILNYPKSFLYNIIADVNKYPTFIPWISEVRILNSYENVVEYELHVDFKIIKEKFSTKDTFYQDEKVEIVLLSGPLKQLDNVWEFKSITDNSTSVSFDIQFEFKSMLLGAAFSKIFLKAQQKIMQSFEEYAQSIYVKTPI